LPVVAFSVSPGLDDAAKNKVFDVRTQQAANDAMSRKGTVVMIWEHHRIADAKLPQECTLRRLLDLDRLGDKVPTTWPEDDYGSIWVVDYGKHGRPKKFEVRQQNFKMHAGKPKRRQISKPPKK
jgi:hypothetical protein